MYLKIAAIICFFLAIRTMFNAFTIALEMLDEKEATDYKIKLGNKLRTLCLSAVLLLTAFVACLLFLYP
jgi:hypothetical protein